MDYSVLLFIVIVLDSAGAAGLVPRGPVVEVRTFLFLWRGATVETLTLVAGVFICWWYLHWGQGTTATRVL